MKLKACLLLLSVVPMLAMANPKYGQQINHLALKQGQDWTWANLAKTPKIKWQQKTPTKIPSANDYYIFGEMGIYGGLSATGTKSKPLYVSIGSGQSYEESEDGENVYKLYDLFNKSEIKEVRSNCTIREGSPAIFTGEYQYFYKWQKKGYRPLYVHERKNISGTFNGGISKNYNIVKDFNDFNHENLYEVTKMDNQGNDVTTCRML